MSSLLSTGEKATLFMHDFISSRVSASCFITLKSFCQFKVKPLGMLSYQLIVDSSVNPLPFSEQTWNAATLARHVSSVAIVLYQASLLSHAVHPSQPQVSQTHAHCFQPSGFPTDSPLMLETRYQALGYYVIALSNLMSFPEKSSARASLFSQQLMPSETFVVPQSYYLVVKHSHTTRFLGLI